MEMASYQENLETLEIPEDNLLTADLSISLRTICLQLTLVVDGNDASDPMMRLAEK
ncbi:uncharacterized protein PHALS_00815 [Plasmopara halstedii]|uniref:Uncharacterized protein n=1 Tax=Plasmopara halstedii TaxID=4781 RepID=A0A0P1ATF8_PLAHL|nr:uncharacterized protein PHALS_00815 [Plasmopara halstedii]CEG44450.1 hypothetical protein PHALS_00815 [Plasmopara halstedii]|eukprot:XP_024580819.1 hypothetical protein PHALS_00815 [Plasmopara halstedii]